MSIVRAVNDYFEVYKNLQKMCKYRGANEIIQCPDCKAKIFERREDFLQSFQATSSAQILAKRIADPYGRPDAYLLVFLISDALGQISTKKNFKERIREANSIYAQFPRNENLAHELIIVVPQIQATSKLDKHIQEAREEKPSIDVTFVTCDRFCIEVPLHVSVPKHEIMLPDEIAELSKSRHVDPSSFQKICVSGPHQDAMAIWMGLLPRMLIRIHRFSDCVGSEIAYRYCVGGDKD
ncbi:MAG: hypothetical protein M0R33_13950 [Methylomonas sp.]|jgi:DNA-directed RNA polymerase subunit H (RpoH/RPB5)|uniref:DNA-directed RNA polymerase subunit RpoH/Rpb5 C-terminal domain-containing protein n=1 Tax=Methylomonas sp. TaxID=418 RepID=UPI0025E48FB2|nr:DNA-directed RNA polymerase subunit RpoH/Rpb5 C-terminal domain-containing protein [Methylomonas sp.]MCK9607539.1 hypothetical protein [Methylomonas sp.]